MGKITGFLEYARQVPEDRPVQERLKDWRNVHIRVSEEKLKIQTARCMDCGVPFCHKGCPLGNIIPEWNDLVYKNRWKEALHLLLLTNDFPEITGRVCPAPCEGSCVLNIDDNSVTIEQIELEIIEHAYESGWMVPILPNHRTGKKVVVIGSGPSGLACANQLNRAGHWVTVFERNDKPGGILMYGIPDFKLEKLVVNRRIDLMKAEGIEFKTGTHVGVNVSPDELRKNYDVIILAGGAGKARDLNIPGRKLEGIYPAMQYLTLQNKRSQGDQIPDEKFISAKDKNVIVIGGGDTGSDCHGTALRQGAKQVLSIELLPKPPIGRTLYNPWPEWPRIFRNSSSHKEGGKREWSVLTKKFTGGNGQVKKIHLVRLQWEENQNGSPSKMTEIPGSDFELDVDLVILALGFVGPETDTVIEQLGLKLTERGNLATDKNFMTNVAGIFSCGDMRRGQSLVVWAIEEGREAARSVDQYLVGQT